MLRQSSGGGSGGGSDSGSGGTKLPLGITRLSGSSFGNWVPGRDSKSCSVTTDASDIPASDPNYIMQLVSDVRKFADVLLQLKEVFNSKGILLKAFGDFLTFYKNVHSHIELICDRPSHILKLTLPFRHKTLLILTWRGKNLDGINALQRDKPQLLSPMLSQCTQVPGLPHCQTGLGHRFSAPGLSGI